MLIVLFILFNDVCMIVCVKLYLLWFRFVIVLYVFIFIVLIVIVLYVCE